MTRRAFLTAACLLACARLAGAQPAVAKRRIALLDYANKASSAANWMVFSRRLAGLGYVEGRDFVLEARWAEGRADRLPALATELVATKPGVIAANSTPAVRALMEATANVPIVMIGPADPVGTGLVASLARPGGNVTGLSAMLTDLALKRLELLAEIVPGAKRFALLGPAANPGVQSVLKELQIAVKARGFEVRLLDAGDATAIERTFDGLASEPVDALLVAAALFPYRQQIVQLVAHHRIPAAYPRLEFLEPGGLLVYGTDLAPQYRRAAEYVHRILQGAKPAELPVEQPMIVWTGVNLRTARALGLKIPQALLLRADRVIE